MSAATITRFRRELLPNPRQFYEREIGKLTRPNSKGWCLGRCPFHESKSGKSFAVNVNSGGFTCFGCGSHGGDVIAFVRLSDRCDFRSACQRLGAWDQQGQPARRTQKVLVPFLVLTFCVDRQQYRAEIRDEPRNEIRALRRYRADVIERLDQIHTGDHEKFTGEDEVQWSILADAWELIEDENR